jgi:hypothetical protein
VQAARDIVALLRAHGAFNTAIQSYVGSDASRGSERVAGLATVDEGSPVGRIGSVPC